MTGNQFLNATACALEASGQSSKRSVSDNLEEEQRKAWACRHVANPKEPLVVGDPAATIKLIRQGARKQRDKLGRRQRSTTPVDISIVASWPVELARLTASDWRGFSNWAKATLAWLGRQFGALGATFGYAVCHLDEKYPHLHVHFHRFGRPAKESHPGYRAGKQYKAAMAAFQTAYFEDVCRHFGMSRNSPRPRRRISRPAHKAGFVIYKDTPARPRRDEDEAAERKSTSLRPRPAPRPQQERNPRKKKSESARLEAGAIISPPPVSVARFDDLDCDGPDRALDRLAPYAIEMYRALSALVPAPAGRPGNPQPGSPGDDDSPRKPASAWPPRPRPR